ncbi:hypothetical protein [Desertivirga brevis]|uniref:hypothetical protein n=1 Tax=Desertivirga brevis TaxID=2810310 RepID=UPI001A971785|nr:hypothetical protein [Pedobacter sp. SYSU D00873]
MKKKLLAVILIFILGLSSVVQAQPPGGGCSPDPEVDCDDDNGPLDSGVYFLLTAGFVYGVMKLRRVEE